MISLKTIINYGNNDTLALTEVKKNRILNAFVCSWILFGFFYILRGFIKEVLMPEITFHCLQIFTASVILFLQKKGYSIVARFIFCLNMFVVFLVGIVLIEVPLFNPYNCLFIFVVPLLLFENTWLRIIGLILAFGSFYYFKYQLFGSDQEGLLVDVIIFGVLFFILFYYSRETTKAENELIEQKNYVEELRIEQDRHFMNLTHELKTPLTILSNSIKTADPLHVNKLVCEEQIKKMSDIVNRSIENLRAEDGLVLDKSDFDIILHTERVFYSLKPLFSKKGISFSLEQYLSFTPLIDGDEFYYERALANLLTNAEQNTESNGSVRITLRENEEGHIEVAIVDSGRGISHKDQHKVFDRFYTKSNLSEESGSGLGLAFVKEVVDKHDGTIRLKSELGEGSNFTITLPIKSKHKLQSYTQTDSELSIKPEGSEKAHIHIVEDNAEILDYLVSILSMYHVTTSKNGKEALKFLGNRSVDLVLTDYMMPEVDGAELVGHLRNRNIQTPIIILTALNDSGIRLNMLRIGVDDYIEKPFDDEELLIRIEYVLKNYYTIKSQAKSDKGEEVFTSGFMQDVVQYIDENCQMINFQAESIYTYFNMSRSTFYRKVKGNSGMNPLELITEVRLQKVRNLVNKKPNISKKELLSLIGWTNSSYLSEKYYERFGKEL